MKQYRIGHCKEFDFMLTQWIPVLGTNILNSVSYQV